MYSPIHHLYVRTNAGITLSLHSLAMSWRQINRGVNPDRSNRLLSSPMGPGRHSGPH